MDRSAHTRPLGEDHVWTATGHEPPVFLDEQGRRRRWVALGGACVGGAAALWLAALVAGAIGFSTLPSMRSGSPLLAARSQLVLARSRAIADRPMLHSAALLSHRSGRNGHRSAVETATELAVSRGLLATR